ncbi:MAG: hypothetical protein CMJ81_23560 [Planctomycetaceae bacterium]|nr:hypothetical protein [Planctomycetaceae bacterium]MBP60288.1 hypothetical protein [Planctomycetaceae bacterium]
MVATQRCLLFLAIFFVAFLSGGVCTEFTKGSTTQLSYYQQILPILRARCHGCHQPAKSGGNYEMTQFNHLLAGGESEATAVVPGHPDQSRLLQLITPNGDVAEMPRGRPALSVAKVALIRQWIAEGAMNDTPESVQPSWDAEHPPLYAAAPVITTLDYSPDGKILAVSGYHEVLLHKSDGSGLVGRLVGMSERIQSAVFSPDGTRLAVAGGSPGRLGELQVWNVVTETLQFSSSVTYDTIYGASWSADNRYIAFGCSDNTVRVVEAKTGKQVLFNGAHNDWVLDTTFSIQGDHVISVSRDRSMKLVELSTARFVDNITSITPGALQGGLQAVECHPTRDELLVGGADGVAKIFRTYRVKARQIGDDHNLIQAFPALPGRIYDVAYSSDGKRIVAGSSSHGTGVVRVFGAEDGQRLAQMEEIVTGVYAVAFNPDGNTIASAGFDGQVYLHESATGRLLNKFVPVPITP